MLAIYPPALYPRLVPGSYLDIASAGISLGAYLSKHSLDYVLVNPRNISRNTLPASISPPATPGLHPGLHPRL